MPQFLHDASEVQLTGLEVWQSHWTFGDDKSLAIRLPQTRPNVAVPIVELFLK